jgi:hypothetical protein
VPEQNYLKGLHWHSIALLPAMEAIGCAPTGAANPVKRRGKAVRRLRRALEEWTNDCDSKQGPADSLMKFNQGAACFMGWTNACIKSEMRPTMAFGSGAAKWGNVTLHS